MGGYQAWVVCCDMCGAECEDVLPAQSKEEAFKEARRVGWLTDDSTTALCSIHCNGRRVRR